MSESKSPDVPPVDQSVTPGPKRPPTPTIEEKLIVEEVALFMSEKLQTEGSRVALIQHPLMQGMVAEWANILISEFLPIITMVDRKQILNILRGRLHELSTQLLLSGSKVQLSGSPKLSLDQPTIRIVLEELATILGSCPAQMLQFARKSPEEMRQGEGASTLVKG